MTRQPRTPLTDDEVEYLSQLANGNALARQRKRDRERRERENRRRMSKW
ncbi:hypothetical protein [Aidingimonas halophila]|uniref:Uncharacterized protein n=1 Tax=Aidingimonas halophila TaxID=574349 RepID=A0A1H2ZU77_9GAMM|nr:hypothetical protein [Aidingimonas halophila]GHC16742.1 hypothetical protein GCM10008094_02600 [Aidingimonas halophila]SDX21140.1 hypothetical protein SAMN05443545_104263 [Aidingimonas halophila]